MLLKKMKPLQLMLNVIQTEKADVLIKKWSLTVQHTCHVSAQCQVSHGQLWLCSMSGWTAWEIFFSYPIKQVEWNGYVVIQPELCDLCKAGHVPSWPPKKCMCMLRTKHHAGTDHFQLILALYMFLISLVNIHMLFLTCHRCLVYKETASVSEKLSACEIKDHSDN